MAFIPSSDSVIAFQSDPTKLVGTFSVVGTITATPTGNQSVSGAVTAPAGSVMMTAQLAGSVLAVSATAAANQSVSGAVTAQAGSIMSVANPAGSTTAVLATQVTSPWIVAPNNSSLFSLQPAGSILAVSATAAANQSVSGTVNTLPLGTIITSLVSTIPSSVIVGTSIFGQLPAGTAVLGSVATLQGTTPWINTNVGSIITVSKDSSVIAYQLAGSVLATSGTAAANQSVSGAVTAPPGSIIQVSGATTTTAGSIISVTNPAGSVTTVAGTVATTQSGTWISSIVSTVPSSVIVGASIFGQLPAGTATLGSVAAIVSNFPANQSVSGATTTTAGSILSVTNPAGSVTAVSGISFSLSSVHIVSGSVITVPTGSTITLNQGSSIIARVTGSVAILGTSGSIMAVTVVSGSTLAFAPAGSLMSVTNPAGSITQVTNTNVGSVIVVWQVPSIVGTYAEDATHTTADKGFFVMGVRNDAVASFTGANLEYNPFGHDSAGRMLIKPFAPGESSLLSTASTVNFGTATAASIRLFVAPGAGLKNYITDFNISNTGAATTLVSFVDEDASVMGRTIAPAGGGSNHSFATPLTTQIANKQVGVIAATATSVLHITLTGYKAP